MAILRGFPSISISHDLMAISGIPVSPIFGQDPYGEWQRFHSTGGHSCVGTAAASGKVAVAAGLQGPATGTGKDS
jgi:hypothetical protein